MAADRQISRESDGGVIMSSSGTQDGMAGIARRVPRTRDRGIGGGRASAQTYGFATLPPGTLNHTTASAISKVLKEKGGMNMLVQPTAGDQVINPLVGRGEVEIGITNIMEAQDALDGAAEGHAHHHRRPCAAHAAVRAQGLRHVQERRPQGQARDDGLFRHAQHRQDRARDAGERRPDRGRRQAGAGAQCGAQRRRVHRRQRRHVLLRLRRPEGEGGRRHRRRHPRARNRRGGHAGCEKDHAVGLSDSDRPGPDLHRRREADEGLQLRQRA